MPVVNQDRGCRMRGVSGAATQKRQRRPTKDGRDTGELLHGTELVAMDDIGAEVIEVTTAGEPKVTKRQLITVVKLVATLWNIDGRGEVAFRAEAITSVPTAWLSAPVAGSMRADAGAGGA
jgi:hypothetical protein